MAMVFGRDHMEILILENGTKVKPTVTVCMCGKMEINMKGSGKCV